MKKTLPLLILLIVALFVTTSSRAVAGAFSLTSIGALSTAGKVYSHWWYTAQNPLLTGTATAASEVTVTIDGAASLVTADSGGVWSFQTTMVDGDHTVTIASGEETLSFTLTIGSTVPEDIATMSGTSVPTTGSVGWTLALGLVAVGSIYAGFKLNLLRLS